MEEKERNALEGCGGYWGPFLTTEEQSELPETDFSGTDDPEAVKPEERYRDKYKRDIQRVPSLTTTYRGD